MKRLGIWQRIGILLSGLWMAGMFLFNWIRETNIANAIYSGAYRLCLDNPKIPSCESDALKEFEIFKMPILGDSLLIALVPVPFGWLLVWVMVKMVQWVLAGRSNASR